MMVQGISPVLIWAINVAYLRTTECLLQSAMQDPRTQIHGRENECKWSPAEKDAW